VVFPAPLGPAMMMIFFKFSACFQDFMLCRADCQPRKTQNFFSCLLEKEGLFYVTSIYG
jgi:hypothetical protein